MGARLHRSYKWAQSAKKANRRTGSVQPPCGCTPSHLRRNQRSRRRTAIQGACNRPAVIRPSTFTATSGQGGEPPHKEHATAPRLCRRSCQYRASSGPSQKVEKINSQNQCSDSRHPAHGPTKALNAEVTGQSAAGTGVVVGVTIGGSAVIASTGVQEQRANRQSSFGPTCRLASSPEAGLGATVSTLNQGYPLLQYEGAAPVRRSLATR
jgi:hypothetical protein